ACWWRSTCDDPIAKLLDPIDQQIRRIHCQRLRLKSIGHTARLHLGIARGPDIHAAVTHHHGEVAGGLAFRHEGLYPDRMRFLLLEAVPSVNALEVASHPE